ncbi:MAG: leucyl aminopeptidase [Notoacmeibacter sp.]|nr:leucyl aminopeptidase [Notoacmeibacter sp.]
MTSRLSINFSKLGVPKKGTVVVLAGEGGELTDAAWACDPQKLFERAFSQAGFKGKLASAMDILVPAGHGYDSLVAVGAGEVGKRDEQAWLRMGGAAIGKAPKAEELAVVLDVPGQEIDAGHAAGFALGMILRAYRFDKYKTKKREDNNGNGNGENGAIGSDKPLKVTIHCANPTAARKAFAEAEAVASGVILARDLVNEPANILGPVEFAEAAKKLESLGVEVEILTEKEMRKLKMHALLGVAQGSIRPPRMAVMRWNGGKAKTKPVAFVGKGVVFDTGGISIKPAGGMEDMKGDMGGAAAVTGLMHALAARKAKANVIGVIGLVENMPDGNAQRPGDIVTSMNGQTIEVINTDAEGRLVLCDALHYTNERFKPQFMINLATLTGAIIIALGHHHAGLFSNDDELATRLASSGDVTGEKVWRMPLGDVYDKLIDSKNADMKNTGGRDAGAITAAQFLKRFVGDTPWAHLDVAGTAMGSPASDISKGWASGFGVRLLDRLVRDHYED